VAATSRIHPPTRNNPPLGSRPAQKAPTSHGAFFFETFKLRNLEIYFLSKNFPIPMRTCTVLIPGFGDVSPALEMCM